MTVFYLTAGEVLSLAGIACDDMRIEVRDAGLLESAVHRPSAEMFGQEAYADIFGKAASLLQSLVINHPLVDGNKRTAWLSCMAFLRMNGESLRPDIDFAEGLVIDVATGKLEDVLVIAARLRSLRESRA
ncbi:type II toxin-antitoxin system death-on-curing family toxin [Streptomyces sp. NPDC059080]|uniref:type II toxin-antitoxin system death-on-curing family toxin n=1 Tax=Streptomyces sp. NPDC059080 TaxID=3346718 RepID=UPI00369B1AAA